MEIIDLSSPRNREMVAAWVAAPAHQRIDTVYSKAEVRAAKLAYERLVAAEAAATNPLPAGVINAGYAGRCAATGRTYAVGTLIHKTSAGWSIWSATSAAPAHRCWECGAPIATATATCSHCGESVRSNWLIG